MKFLPTVYCALIFTSAGRALSGETTFNPAEEIKINDCEAGAGELDPGISAGCLAEELLLEKLYKHSPDRWLRFTQRADMAKDLGDLLDSHTSASSLRAALLTRLDGKSPATALDLGPEPEKLLRWVEKFRREKLDLASEAMCEWPTLDENRKSWLNANGFFSENWAKLSLSERQNKFSEFAKTEAGRLMQTPPELEADSAEAVIARAFPLWDSLDGPTSIKLRTHINRLKTIVALKKNLREASASAGLIALDDTLEEIKDLPPQEQLARLSEFFDNNPVLSTPETVNILASQRKSRKAEKLSKSERRALSLPLKMALMNEIKGTRAGDRLLLFFQNSKTAPLPIVASVNGYAKLSHSRITFDKGLIEQWMRLTGTSSSELLNNPRKTRELARFLSPIFVHESLHLEQNAWRRKNRISDSFSQDGEIEAMSAEALFFAEKSRKDREFRKMVSALGEYSDYLSEETDYVKALLEDPREFRRKIRCETYSTRPSFEAAEAMYMQRTGMNLILEELKRRGNLPSDEQRKLLKSRIRITGKAPRSEIISEVGTKKLEQTRNYYFRWHSQLKKRTESEVKWTGDTLKELLYDKKS